MANKRELKKSIRMVCCDLLSECVAMSLYDGKKEADNINAIISSIFSIYGNSISRVSHPEQGMPPKLYFKDLRDKFEQEICEIIDVLGNL
ncbi:MAG: hypothetical protein ACI4V5_09010 [Prevotella sp.]